MSEPLLPRYDSGSLAELLPSISARFGMPGVSDTLDLPGSDRYVVLLIDGLGLAHLRACEGLAPHLGGATAGSLTSVVPSTTATALTSLGTGLPPGQHGMAGYTFRNPFTGDELNALEWAPDLSGLDIQPRLTAFERLARHGVVVSSVLPARFAGTGLTEAGLRGPRFVGVTDESARERRIEQIVDAVGAGPRTLVYCYERSLDHIAHGAGVDSAEWRAALAWVDSFAAGLRQALPDDVRLVITADHGMVDVPRASRLVVEDHPGLLADVDLFAGEGRFRHLYTSRPDAVASRWRKELGDRAWVRTRAEAVEEDWFGFTTPAMATRFGDVVVASKGTHAVMTRRRPREMQLVGMHGSLTSDEMLVPLIVE